VGFGVLGAGELVAPALLWSEFRSAAHEAAWRGEVTPIRRDLLLARLAASPVRERRHSGHGAETTRIADQLGWAKTYDAEYVALASLLGCSLVTLDGRLRRGADRLGLVVTPAEL
jgi:predicted nucleic acid-binding protein